MDSMARSIRAVIILSCFDMCFGTWFAQASTSARGGSTTRDVAGIPEVTVMAPRPPTPQELAGESVPNFVASHAVPSIVIHQIPRWRTSLCPVTIGLSPAFNQFVSARIEAVAAAVGAPQHSNAECKYHNVEIFFSAEPQKQLDEFVKFDARVLGFHYPHQTKRLATFNRPIQGWYVTATRSDSGGQAVDDPLPLPVGPPGFWSPVPPGELGSRLNNGRSSVIINALIGVDINRVIGMSIGSISDYIAMLVLSQSKSPDTCGQLPSIIDLMASNCTDRERPTQVTAGDLAFLHALYKVNLSSPVELEQSSLEDHMMREFKGP